MRRRKGYAERNHEIVAQRRKKEIRRQKMVVFGACSIFSGLIIWIYWMLWMWANGYIGG